MRRIRFLVFTVVGLVATFLGAFIAPGTLFNRAVSVALCTVLSFDSHACTGPWSKPDRVVAASPPAVERTVAEVNGSWLGQRREFDEDPVSPSGGNYQVPAYPEDPGPNIIRPDFDAPGSSQPNQMQTNDDTLAGLWFYSIYLPSEDETEFLKIYSNWAEIDQSTDEYTITLCELEPCSQVDNLPSRIDAFARSIPKEEVIIENYDALSIETVESIDNQVVWGTG